MLWTVIFLTKMNFVGNMKTKANMKDQNENFEK